MITTANQPPFEGLLFPTGIEPTPLFLTATAGSQSSVFETTFM